MKNRNRLAIGTVMFISVVGFASIANAAAAPSYPPHGYPCLGCHPCPPDYCDDLNPSKLVKFNSKGVPLQKQYRGETIKQKK